MGSNVQDRLDRGRPRHPDVLTPAEWKVAELVRHGMTNRGIAERLGVSLDAVKFHVGNALAKLGFATRNELRRWSGVAAGSAMDQHRRSAMDAAAGSDMMLGQVARTVRDVDEARTWYRDVLGLPELYAFPGLAFFDLGGVRLMLSAQDGGSGASASILYLRVPDIHTAKAALEQRGVRFTHAPHRIHRHEDGTEEWMAFFEDDEGRPLALMTQVHPAG
jgi:DNA-binding CsgD family transcriptional regulator/catechol 2,3-dioxygenase-like lactoylglutathione lyase family enzyme